MEPYHSVLLWLLDLCVEVAYFSPINKMNSKNLAIVIAPNLFDPTSIKDPGKLLEVCGVGV